MKYFTPNVNLQQLQKIKKKVHQFNHEIFYAKFLIKKLHHIQKESRRTKHFTPGNKTFTPNLVFSPNQREILHEKSKFLHQIRNILYQTDGTFGLLQFSYKKHVFFMQVSSKTVKIKILSKRYILVIFLRTLSVSSFSF